MKWNFASCVLQEVWHLQGGSFLLDSRNTDAGYEANSDEGSISRAVSMTAQELIGSTLPSSDAFLQEVQRAAGTMNLRIRWAHETHFGQSESKDLLSQREYAVLSTSSVFGPASAIADRGLLPSAISLLRDVAQQRTDGAFCAWDEMPILWSRGTAGVLFHEAIGHPAERSMTSDFFPAWLEVRDLPLQSGLGELWRDDVGERTREANLREESPRALRRASYRQPLSMRLTNVVCSSTASESIDLPERYIEVIAVAGGEYDPPADRVTLAVSCSNLVEGGHRSALTSFRYSATRGAIAASLQVCGSRIVPYPGVLCSDDGQTLPVGTFSPDLLTRPLRR
ncbi:MAG TPA: hypothetical protein VHL58_16215 [Thermoanaerobaculia bacterium]|nr:hypothetical protein [Thermoanaerobaculia bacterium]